MSKEVRYKDETFYNEAVRAYIDHDWGNGRHYTPNAGFRRDIVRTVVTYDDLCIWIALIERWGYADRTTGKWKARNPLDVKGLLTVFEMKQREAQRKKDEIQRAKDLRERSQQGVPKRSVSPMFNLRRRANGWKG